jgi:peptide/nickel transport system ATP-binding protein
VTNEGTAALIVRELAVTYLGSPPTRALDGVSLDVFPGRCVAVVGESGSGKSTLAHALIGLTSSASVDGCRHLGTLDLGELDESGWKRVRWRRIALAPQSPASLNPVLRIGLQMAEPQIVHLGRDRPGADTRSAEALAAVGLDDWALDRYPDQLSGGQRRLVLVALTLVCDPEVIVLDEPTAGLDPVTRDQVIVTLARLRDDGRAIVVLGHDVDAFAALADQVAVLYRGWLAEVGPTARILDAPRSPYSWSLLNSRPTLASVKDLRGIRGDPPAPAEIVAGCPFHPRCHQAVTDCTTVRPDLVAPTEEDGARLVACIRGGLVPVLRAHGITVTYPGTPRHPPAPAVDGVSLEVHAGEVVGVAGPTGAGKSTLALALVRLVEPDRGTLELDGADLSSARGADLRRLRRRAQLLFQDPYQALSPRLTVAEIVREPLDVQEVGPPDGRNERVRRELAAVRLPAVDAFLARRAHELSGGQLQRVALARALVLEPAVLVADEPVSMLDPSEQAKLLQLLKQLQVDHGMAMVIVSHDLAVLLRIADRVMVMDRGRVVETGTGTQLLVAPEHPVTRALLGAAGRDRLLAALDAHNCRPRT